MSYKLGSLFDGSGGFPLAGSLCGIEPVWAAEVEPYPIAVTRTHFPNMKHLGDISKVNGAEIEPVDIITFGSPCQDLSVAGKRAGLKHEANGDEETTRSGLFMEAVRIIKEMRLSTNGKYPTFALWENVPGAFSSNKGEDFRTVCEELIKIIEPSAVMPPVPKGGWAYADSYCGDGWSLAYRVFDAQYWGVPQRRRRIHLVLDLRGERAREVLFEREGVRGYFTESGTPWQGITENAERCAGADDREGEGFDGYNGDLTGDTAATLGVNCGVSTGRNGVIERRGRQLGAVGFLRQLGGVEAIEETAPTLMAAAGMSGNNKPCVAYSFDSLASNSMKSKNPHSGCRAVEVAKTLDTTDPNPSKNQGGLAIVCMATQQGGAEVRTDDKAPTVTAAAGTSGNNQPVVAYAVDQGGGKSSANVHKEKSPTLTCTHGGAPAVAYTMKIRSGKEGGGKGALVQEDKSATLATNNDQYLFQPVSHTMIIDNIGGQAEYGYESLVNGTLRAGAQGAIAYVIENHPADSRVNIDESGKVQTLTSRMGTGGGNVPMIMEPYCKSSRPKSADDATTWKPGKVANTLNTFDVGEVRTNELVVVGDPTYCLQGNGIDRADTAGCNGKGWKEDVCYTLNTIDRPAVAYGIDQGATRDVGKLFIEEKSKTLTNGSCPGHHNGVVVAYGLDRASFNQGQNAKFDFSIAEEQQPTLVARGPGAVCCTTGSFTQATEKVSPTLMARDWKDPTVIVYPKNEVHYIVRRLTPTECARLQGFADRWGDIAEKDNLTENEYRFWLEVRNTHAAINGKAVKDYTAKQILTWYSKLQTDSAEYKMWGNGIALPPALYCMQGIVEALTSEEDDWLN